MMDVNAYAAATDNETIEAALAQLENDRVLVIPPRVSAVEPERTYWLLDRAILIPENTTVLLKNCTIKLSDRCRDNFFRTANCGMGVADPPRIRNVHLRGEGLCVLQGADHPRSTGDSSKQLAVPCPYETEDLVKYGDWIPAERRTPEGIQFWDRHDHTYGTDVNDPNESHYGDWRDIGVLFANVEDFSISGLRLVEYHGWGISMEACANGRVEKIDFDACMSKVIDGMRMNIENQDGVNLRNGCHHIVVSDITGRTGDDIVALTAIADDTCRPGGSLCSTHVMHSDWARRERDIHDVIIRNVIGYSQLCISVRLLACNTHIYNVVIDGIIDTAPDSVKHHSSVIIGQADSEYGKNLPDGVRNVTISNVVNHGQQCIVVGGYLKDSVISNVVNCNPDCPVITVDREDGLNHVLTSNLLTVGKA